MENNWFYLDPSKPAESCRLGPFTRKQIEGFALEGLLGKDNLVWYPGLVTWLPWKDVAPDFPGNSEAVAPPAVAGSTIPASMPEIVRPTPVITLPAEHYASFGIRLAAFLVDLMILGSLNAGLILVYLFLFHIPESVLRDSLAINIPGLMLEACYQVYFLSCYGGTPGKMLMGLRVISVDGSGLTVAHALGRYFSFWASALSLGAGFLIIFFDPQRRALHDHLAKTRVIFFRTPLQ